MQRQPVSQHTLNAYAVNLILAPESNHPHRQCMNPSSLELFFLWHASGSINDRCFPFSCAYYSFCVSRLHVNLAVSALQDIQDTIFVHGGPSFLHTRHVFGAVVKAHETTIAHFATTPRGFRRRQGGCTGRRTTLARGHDGHVRLGIGYVTTNQPV